MNKQEAFNKSWHGVINQKRPSRRWVDSSQQLVCCLKSNGNKCAIGHLIPDEEYTPSLEETTWSQLISETPSLKGLNKQFLRELREAHDQASLRFNVIIDREEKFLVAFKERMNNIAKDFNLTIPTDNE